MRNTIRRNPNVSYAVQMFMREEDAVKSRMHHNGIANTLVQRNISHMNRQVDAAVKAQSRAARSQRRHDRPRGQEKSYNLEAADVFLLLRAGFRVRDRRHSGTGVHALPL